MSEQVCFITFPVFSTESVLKKREIYQFLLESKFCFCISIRFDSDSYFGNLTMKHNYYIIFGGNYGWGQNYLLEINQQK
jgi:hypothetical protein